MSERSARAMLAALSVGGLLVSGYLTWLELFVIQAICQWCVVSAALMVGSLVFASLRVRQLGSRWK